MIKRKHVVGLSAVAVMGLLAQAAQATPLPFLDTFDSFQAGSTGSNFTTTASTWSVLNGANVDLIGASQIAVWGVHCYGGSSGCIELDGSNIDNSPTGPMVVSGSFALLAGHTYTLSAQISGNQTASQNAAAASPDTVNFAFIASPVTGTGVAISSTGSTGALSPSADYSLFSLLYTPSSNVTASISFWNIGLSDSYGALIDNVSVVDTTAAVPLPASAWLLLTGLLGLGLLSRRNGGQALLRI